MRKVSYRTYQKRLNEIKYLKQREGELEDIVRRIDDKLGKEKITLQIPLSSRGMGKNDFLTDINMNEGFLLNLRNIIV